MGNKVSYFKRRHSFRERSSTIDNDVMPRRSYRFKRSARASEKGTSSTAGRQLLNPDQNFPDSYSQPETSNSDNKTVAKTTVTLDIDIIKKLNIYDADAPDFVQRRPFVGHLNRLKSQSESEIDLQLRDHEEFSRVAGENSTKNRRTSGLVQINNDIFNDFKMPDGLRGTVDRSNLNLDDFVKKLDEKMDKMKMDNYVYNYQYPTLGNDSIPRRRVRVDSGITSSNRWWSISDLNTTRGSQELLPCRLSNPTFGSRDSLPLASGTLESGFSELKSNEADVVGNGPLNCVGSLKSSNVKSSATFAAKPPLDYANDRTSAMNLSPARNVQNRRINSALSIDPPSTIAEYVQLPPGPMSPIDESPPLSAHFEKGAAAVTSSTGYASFPIPVREQCRDVKSHKLSRSSRTGYSFHGLRSSAQPLDVSPSLRRHNRAGSLSSLNSNKTADRDLESQDVHGSETVVSRGVMSDICPTCRLLFDGGKKRRLVDTCGHERCYSCIFASDQCPICFTHLGDNRIDSGGRNRSKKSQFPRDVSLLVESPLEVDTRCSDQLIGDPLPRRDAPEKEADSSRLVGRCKRRHID